MISDINFQVIKSHIFKDDTQCFIIVSYYMIKKQNENVFNRFI